MVVIKITMTNSGTIETSPYSYESKEDFYKRVKAILELAFQLEDNKLTVPDKNKLKNNAQKQNNDTNGGKPVL